MRTTVRNSYSPKTGDYCSMIVVDEDKQVQYIFDQDGVYTTYTSKTQEGAPKSYVDAKDADTLDAANMYTDDLTASTLENAKAYTDSVAVDKSYVDQHDASTLQAAKDYADSMDVVTLDQAQTMITNATGSVTTDLGDRITALQNSLSTVATSGDYNDLSNLPSIPVITMTTTDPGEGSPLEANHFIAVYTDSERE